jgi:hypothetical protein
MWKAYLLAAMCRIKFIAKPLLQQAVDAWLHWTQSDF